MAHESTEQEAVKIENNKEICHSSAQHFPPQFLHPLICAATWHPLKKLSEQIYAQFYHKSRMTLVSPFRKSERRFAIFKKFAATTRSGKAAFT